MAASVSPESEEPSVEARVALLDGYVEALEHGDAPAPEAWAEQHGMALDDELRGQLEVLGSLFGAAQSIQLDASMDETAGARKGAKPSERRFLSPGTKLGECEVERLLGYGGMGEVYCARHAVLDREVAIKVMRPVLAEDPRALERFREEVKAVAKLGAHPNVVAAMHASEHEGRLYLVMEYVPGGDLQQLVAAEGPLDAPRAAAYLRQAAAGLQHAHAAGLVHRDVKPSNLLLAPEPPSKDGRGEGTVKVVDLGLARLVMGGERSPRWADELVGSLDYMAPEQADDPNAADARSDLYALGCTFYFLLTGAPPFAERLTLKKLMAHATQAPAPVPDLHEGLQRILDTLLAKRPVDRFQTATELVKALDALDSEWGVQSPKRALEDSESDNERLEEAGEPPRNGAPGGARDGARLLAWGFALLFAATLTALLVVVLRPEPEPRPVAPVVATLGFGAPIEGLLEATDERLPKTGSYLDAYPLEVEAGTTYVATMRSRAVDPALVLRSARGWEMAASDDAPGLGSTAQIVWRAEASGEVELVATSEQEARTGAYVLSVTALTDPELRAEVAVEGVLDAESSRFWEDDTPMDRYWLPVTLGETYLIEMGAESFQPATFVMSDEGTVLQAGAPLNEAASRVVYTATSTGVVFVAANLSTQDEGLGAYTLTLQNVLAGALLLDETGLLAEGDARARDESFYDPYPIEVEAGRTYVISMSSEDFDTYLLLVDAEDERIARNDDALGTDSRLVWRAPTTGTYRIFANSYAPGTTGAYRVTARALPASPPSPD